MYNINTTELITNILDIKNDITISLLINISLYLICNNTLL
jgi:hypothetical protein